MSCTAISGAPCCCNTDIFLYFNPCPDAPPDAEGFKALKSTWSSILPGNPQVNDVYNYDPGTSGGTAYCGKLEETGSSTGSPPSTGFTEVSGCSDSACGAELIFFEPCDRSRAHVYSLAATGAAWESLLGITISDSSTWQNKVWSYKRNDGEDCCSEYPCVEFCGSLSLFGDTSRLCYEPGVGAQQKRQCSGCRVENLETQVIDANSDVTFTPVNYSETSDQCKAPICHYCQVPGCADEGFIKVRGTKSFTLFCTLNGSELIDIRDAGLGVEGCRDQECSISTQLVATVEYEALFEIDNEPKFTAWPISPVPGDTGNDLIIAEYFLSSVNIINAELTGNLGCTSNRRFFENSPDSDNTSCHGPSGDLTLHTCNAIFSLSDITFENGRLQKRLGYLTRDMHAADKQTMDDIGTDQAAAFEFSGYKEHFWKQIDSNDAAPNIDPSDDVEQLQCYMTMTTECTMRPRVQWSGNATLDDVDFILSSNATYDSNPVEDGFDACFVVRMSDCLVDVGGGSFSCCVPERESTNLFDKMSWTNAPLTLGPPVGPGSGGDSFVGFAERNAFRPIPFDNRVPVINTGDLAYGEFITRARNEISHLWAAEYIFFKEEDQDGNDLEYGVRAAIYRPNIPNPSGNPFIKGCGFGMGYSELLGAELPSGSFPIGAIATESGAPWLSRNGNINGPGNDRDKGTLNYPDNPDGTSGIHCVLRLKPDAAQRGVDMQGFPEFQSGWEFQFSTSETGPYFTGAAAGGPSGGITYFRKPVSSSGSGCDGCFRTTGIGHNFTYYHTVDSIDCSG